jgi:hypothetical protein
MIVSFDYAILQRSLLTSLCICAIYTEVGCIIALLGKSRLVSAEDDGDEKTLNAVAGLEIWEVAYDNALLDL